MDRFSVVTYPPASHDQGGPHQERQANPGDEKTIDPVERRRRAIEAITELSQTHSAGL